MFDNDCLLVRSSQRDYVAASVAPPHAVVAPPPAVGAVPGTDVPCLTACSQRLFDSLKVLHFSMKSHRFVCRLVSIVVTLAQSVRQKHECH